MAADNTVGLSPSVHGVLATKISKLCLTATPIKGSLVFWNPPLSVSRSQGQGWGCSQRASGSKGVPELDGLLVRTSSLLPLSTPISSAHHLPRGHQAPTLTLTPSAPAQSHYKAACRAPATSGALTQPALHLLVHDLISESTPHPSSPALPTGPPGNQSSPQHISFTPKRVLTDVFRLRSSFPRGDGSSVSATALVLLALEAGTVSLIFALVSDLPSSPVSPPLQTTL